ncbi:MAG: hypothetical protein WAN11_01120 [Syntrophobacteraceae bacterium]
MNHNAFRSVIVKESSPLIAGKGYEMSMALAIIDPALHCRPLLEFCRVASCASRPDSEYPGYPDITSLPGSIQRIQRDKFNVQLARTLSPACEIPPEQYDPDV